MTVPSSAERDVAEVARGLTKAQRAAVLGERSLSYGGGMWPLRHSLAAKGLTTGFGATWTPLGLAVRAHLQGIQTSKDEI